MEKPDHSLYSYPRTPHLPFSPGATSDDKWIYDEDLRYLSSGIEILVTEKYDGGNVSLYPDYFHGRSLDSGTHSWETVSKALWSRIRYDIPKGWRLSCESMYARRSIAYEGLKSPLYIIGIWDENNVLLDWDSTVQWAELIGLPTVPVLYRGTDFNKGIQIWNTLLDRNISEGFVVRDVGQIPYSKFGNRVAKWVRNSHVTTSADWRHRDDFSLNTFH